MRLTDIGGHFPAWSSDGRTVHWTIGNAHFAYNLDAAEAFADSVEAAQRSGKRKRGTLRRTPQRTKRPGTKQADEEADEEGDEEEEAEYQPLERRIEIAFDRDTPEGTVVLRGARLITMRGAGAGGDAEEVIENGDIWSSRATGSWASGLRVRSRSPTAPK